MKGFTLTQTERGRKQWILHSVRAEVSDAGAVEMKTPKIDIYKGEKVMTKVQSSSGTYDAASQNVRLTGDVIVLTDDPKSGPTRLETDQMDYLNAKQRFETDRPVVIKRKTSTVRGRGMSANHDLSEIRIMNQEATF